MVWIVKPAANVIAPVHPQKFSCNTIAGIELIDGWLYIHLACRHTPVDLPEASQQQVVEVTLQWPLADLPAALFAMMRCLLPAAGIGANDNVVSLRDTAH
jgi:hypothetical protein